MTVEQFILSKLHVIIPTALTIAGGAVLLVRWFRSRRQTIEQILARVMAEQIRIEAAHHCKFVPHHRLKACTQRARLYFKSARVKKPLDLASRVKKLLENG